MVSASGNKVALVGDDVAVKRTRIAGTRSRRQLELAGERLGIPAKDGIVAERGDDVVGRLDEEHLRRKRGR